MYTVGNDIELSVGMGTCRRLKYWGFVLKYELSDLIEIMARLRDPKGGCPWDLEQDFKSIAPYTIEEAYEVADAIASEDMESLKGELGDLLFQVVYHARMAEEAGHFDFGDVVESVSEKMTRRHPHVFGDAEVESAEEQSEAWEDHKAAERAANGQADDGSVASILEDVPLALPALMRAEKLQRRAARVGFDWADTTRVLQKMSEEMQELGQAMMIYAVNRNEATKNQLAGEIGDLLFVCVNLARHLGVNSETALRGTNRKFQRRFGFIEEKLAAAGRELESASLEEMEALWQGAKKSEAHRQAGIAG